MLKTFITNLGLYNEGYLVGKWIDLPIDDDELEKVLKEINDELTDKDRKAKLVKQLKLYDKVMGYK